MLVSTRFHLHRKRRLHTDLPSKLEKQPLLATESWDKVLFPVLLFEEALSFPSSSTHDTIKSH